MRSFLCRLRFESIRISILFFAVLIGVTGTIRAQDSEILGMVREFEKVMFGNQRQKQAVARKVFRKYGDYKKLLELSGDQVSNATRAAH